MSIATLAAAVRRSIAVRIALFEAPRDPALLEADTAAWTATCAQLPGIGMGRIEYVINRAASTRAGRRTSYNLDVPAHVVARYQAPVTLAVSLLAVLNADAAANDREWTVDATGALVSA